MRRKSEIRNSKFEANSNSENRIRGIRNLRISRFDFRVFVCALAFYQINIALAQPRRLEQAPSLSPTEGAREAKALVAEMLAARPEENSTNLGVLKIRDPEGNQRATPIKIITVISPKNWQQIYEASSGASAMTLTINHTSEKTNQYFLSTSGSAPKLLSSGELMSAFAGSDFWIADLGYEFLRWPKQTVIKNDMRHSRACKVLESINPNPSAGGYTRVLCWITVEKPHAPVHADAYDASGRFKQFDPKNLEKVNGVYQIESVEMRNSKTGSHTVLEFDAGAK
jgi:hypothetical protein